MRSPTKAGLIAVAALALAGPLRAGGVVNAGYDLLQTEPGTAFAGVDFVGVPLGTFDFGGGPVATGLTDTIMQRLAPAAGPSQSIPVEIVALQLVSATPVDFGLGLGFYFITLQSARGGPASSGQRTIDFGPEGSPHGTFSSFFDVFFDIRLGALDGPIALSDSLIVTADGVPWSHEPPPGAVQIPGVNTFLNGQDREADFFPIGTFVETTLTGATHALETATIVPEPASLAMAGLPALLGLVAARRRSRTSA